MADELISVIIPVYNVEQYVRQTLDSIINQTYRNLEILVVDDGSTDNSPAICDEYTADKRVRVFHRQNSGVAASRQFGVDMSNGAYFVSIDSDDYVSDDFVEKLYRSITRNEADISVCGVSCFSDGDNGDIKTGYTYIPSACLDEKLQVTKELLVSDYFKLTIDYLLSDSWNKLFRTQFVKDTNVRYELGKQYAGSELQFCHKLIMHCPSFCVCRESLLFHRNRDGSIMQKRKKNFQEGFEIITESLIEECRLVGISIRDQLSSVYYGLIGLAILDIHYFGGTVREKHGEFKALINENNRFLDSHRDQLERRKGFQTFLFTRFSLPAFLLSNALWLDAAMLCYGFLRKCKLRIIRR